MPNSSRQQWVRWFINPPVDVLYWYIHFTFLYLNCFLHAVIYFVHCALSLIILFILCACCDTRCFKMFVYFCLSKSKPYWAYVLVVQYSTQNKIPLSMSSSLLFVYVCMLYPCEPMCIFYLCHRVHCHL